ncbi:MAG: type IV pilus twitching motility protein PilT [candidate division Zixibacteria bacterium]|nr:type IV pilus twitching motility protein PilT [candidate division Zixibacteria bacterium]
MAQIDELLQIVKSADASDLHLVAGSVPMIRIGGLLEKTRHRTLSDQEIRHLIYEILTDKQIRSFESTGDLDLAYGIHGVARFRLNIYSTQSGIAAAIRLIPDQILDLQDLGLPKSIASLAECQSGLVLVTGPTNSGKTTTLASLANHINTNFSKHIISLEDPIEYVHHNKNSLVSQRQIGLHSESFAKALRASLREDPNIILVGEMRDIETISLALTAAEIGLLVMGTLHTCTAAATIDRIIDVFPPEQQQQIRVMLANSLRGIIAQQLVRKAAGGGRIVAYEILLQTQSISSLIREGKSHQIPNAILTGGKQGMKLLDNHLHALVDSGQILAQEAIRVAVDPSRFYDNIERNESDTIEVVH